MQQFDEILVYNWHMLFMQPVFFTKRRVIDYARAKGCMCWVLI